MTRRIIARAFLLVASSGVAIAAGIVPAQAAEAPHPAPLCGALNMVESSPSYYQYAVSSGMDTAMTIDAAHGSGANGNAGMFLAVTQSSQASGPSCS